MKTHSSPAVSVIIPTHNRWPLIQEAVESVRAQSFEDFELIVVDDGSDDGTGERLAACGFDFRLVVQPRRGVSAARNNGASVARGRYLAFLDSDDLWLPEKLSLQTVFMDSHPEIQICQTEEVWLRNGVRVNPKAKHRKPNGDIFRPSLELCLVSPSAVMMSQELFDRVGGFDENFPVCEDYDLWLRIAADYPVALITQPLVIKRGGHADQLSRSLWGMDRFRVRAMQKFLHAGVNGERRAWVIDALRRKTAVLAQGARKRGKEQEAAVYEESLRDCLREKPDVGTGDSRICRATGIPPADAGALVGMGTERREGSLSTRSRSENRREPSARSDGLA